MTIIDIRGKDAEHFGPTVDGAVSDVVVIHGYNEPLKRVEDVYSEFERLLGVAFTLFLWPAGDDALGYLEAVRRSGDAGYRLRDILSGRRANWLITHSLGAQVALRSLVRPPSAPWAQGLIMMAPAVDDDTFSSSPAGMGDLSSAKNVHVLFSENDPVLRKYYPPGEGISEERWLPTALGLHGLKTPVPGISQIDCSAIVKGHGEYLWRPQVAAMVREITNV